MNNREKRLESISKDETEENVVEIYGNISSKAIFNSNKTHRYVLERRWNCDKDKKMASIIMFNPSYADEIHYDYTSMKIINYLIDTNEFNGVYILNLYSIIETDSKKVTGTNKTAGKKENDKYISNYLKKSSKIYKAWGSNNSNKNRIKEIISILKGIETDSIYELTDIDEQAKHPSRCTIVGEKILAIKDIL